jgi:hypothetical protein
MSKAKALIGIIGDNTGVMPNQGVPARGQGMIAAVSAALQHVPVYQIEAAGDLASLAELVDETLQSLGKTSHGGQDKNGEA